MRTEYIKTALKVAQTGHFSTAAKELYLCHPSVLHRIHSLETELGFPLFETQPWNRAPLVPTERGARWLVLARRAMGLLDQAAVEVKVNRRGLRS